MRFAEFFRKAAHALSANFLSLLISVLTTLLVPRLLGVEEFGYFQLYLFYASYVGLLHFGWNDGVLLRYGGANYRELPKESIFSQFILLVSQQALAATAVWLIAPWFVDDIEGRFIASMTAICILLSGPNYMLMFLLQATSRIQEFSRIIIVQRGLFGLLVILLSLSPYLSFRLLIYAELTSRAIALVLSLYFCRDVVALNIRRFSWSWRDIHENLRGGFPLMLSAMAGSLIIGVVRFGIAENWSIEIFGKVSLSLSLANMVLTTIVAVGHVLFPFLRRASEKNLPRIYASGRTILSTLTLPALFLYFLLVPFITHWLPLYTDSAHFLGIIFPLFIYQVRTSILLEPYLKAMRREKTLLGINLCVLLLSVLMTVICVGILNNLQLSLVSIVILAALRALALEHIVAKQMKLRMISAVWLESLVIAVFLGSILFLKPFGASVCLALTLSLWFLANRTQLRSAIQFVKYG